MKLITKVSMLALALALIMSTTACSSGSETSGTASPSDSASSEASEVSAAVSDTTGDADANVAVFYYTYADVYISSVRTALDAQLDSLGVTYQDYDSNNNQTLQNEQIDTAISTGADVLVVNLVTTGSVDAASAIVQKAEAADVTIIFFNRAVGTDTDEELQVLSYTKCAFVGTDAPEAGHLQGEMIGEYLVENYDAVDLNGDGVISYAMFMGQPGNVEAIYRTQYSVEDANAILAENNYPELEFFDSSNSDSYQADPNGAWSATAANEYMTTNLSQYNEENGNMIELIICNNDDMATGAVSALNDKGYNLGTADSTLIPVFGVDATDAAIQLIDDGKMVGTVKQDAEGMAECIADLVNNVATGGELMDTASSYTIAEDVFNENEVANKIYIPYGVYTG